MFPTLSIIRSCPTWEEIYVEQLLNKFVIVRSLLAFCPLPSDLWITWQPPPENNH